MKKLLLFAILGMSSLAFSQPYNYLPFDGASMAYSVPDATIDEAAELSTNGQTFSKFDRTVAASLPEQDNEKTFGRNLSSPFTSTDTAGGNDLLRSWVTNVASILPSPGYYTCIRTHVSGGPRSWGAWMYYTVNFTEAAKFNPILRVRDGATDRDQTYEISLYKKSDMSAPVKTITTNFKGAATEASNSTDGSAKLVKINTAGTGGTVWFKVLDNFNITVAGEYVVKISNTACVGAGGLSAYTFWKEAAAVAPEVAITAPVPNSVFDQGNLIALTAKANPGDGTVSKVEFFDGATSLGMGTAAGGGIYTLNVTAGASKVYDFKAVVTETGGVAPDNATSSAVKVMSIGNAEDNFNGTTYPGKPWNNTKWAFGNNNATNFKVGGALDRVVGVDKYQGVPFFAYDLGAVNNTFDKSSTSLRYVAGSATSQGSIVGVDDRLTQKGANVLSFSDDYSRAVTTVGAGRFLGSSTDYRFSAGGAWARYSSKFTAGKYKLLVRATDGCNANYNIYVRILKADGTVVGSYYVNGGNAAAGCPNELNATKLLGNPTYAALTAPTATTQWIMMNDEISIDGDVIVELSDPDPALGANSPGPGVFGEFTFEYTGGLSTSDFSTSDFKVYTTNRIIYVNADSNEDANVTIYDINGKLIATKVIVDGAASAEVPTSGIYIVKAQAAGKNAKTVKVVVN